MSRDASLLANMARSATAEAAAARLGQHPDSTEARQAAIRRLIRLLDKERRACVRIEAFADEFREARTMQCLVRIGNAEGQARHAHDEVATAWAQYRAASGHEMTRSDAA